MVPNFGYTGQILNVDLSKGEISTIELSRETALSHLGGRGLGIKVLAELTDQGTKAYSADNPLIIATGPLAGTIFPGANRTVIISKSPLTGIYGAAVAGGGFAPELKYAGFDAIIVKGIAEEPVYLSIEDGAAKIKKAAHIWGKTTTQAREAIVAETGEQGLKTLLIGPAGEKLVRYASIYHEGRAAGRCGMGAVMGSKKLKAICAKGKDQVGVKDPRLFMEAARDLNEALAKNQRMKVFRIYGTTLNVQAVNALGIFPTNNFQTGVFNGATQLDHNAIRGNYSYKNTACFACPIACTQLSKVAHGEYSGSKTKGPEYETLFALGSNCGNSNLASIIKANQICDDLGLDTMSCGSVIAFTMECFEKGLISSSDLDGLSPRFGDHDAMIKLIEMIANRQGAGDYLAEGIARMAEKIGAACKNFSTHIKGLEMGGYEPRGLKGEGLSMATAERGGCHHYGGYAVHAETMPGVDSCATAGKGKLIAAIRHKTVLMDSVTICSFFSASVDFGLLSKALTSATGLDFSQDRLMEIARRIIAHERSYNAICGLKRQDDSLPGRFLTEPLPDGPPKGQTVDLDSMLSEFYAEMGWHPETAVPTEERLMELGLAGMAKALYK